MEKKDKSLEEDTVVDGVRVESSAPPVQALPVDVVSPAEEQSQPAEASSKPASKTPSKGYSEAPLSQAGTSLPKGSAVEQPKAPPAPAAESKIVAAAYQEQAYDPEVDKQAPMAKMSLKLFFSLLLFIAAAAFFMMLAYGVRQKTAAEDALEQAAVEAEATQGLPVKEPASEASAEEAEPEATP